MSKTTSSNCLRKSICLTMIVKDEAHVIKRCLDSVKPFIDSWTIVDTGSTDGTQELVKELLKDVPGELYERPWRDFGHNRSEAIELASPTADYMLFLDADEVFQAPSEFEWPELTGDAYLLQMGDGDNRYLREILASTSLTWRFVGVLHEYLTADRPYRSERLEGPYVEGHFDGGRSQGRDLKAKYARDAQVLEDALKGDPENTRYVFYLAQSYRDSGEAAKALETYERRAAMGGWDEEVWYSLYQMAKLSEQLKWPEQAVTERFLKAFEFRPRRAEPLVHLASYYRQREKHALGFIYAQAAVQIKQPDDMLFLDRSCYTWRPLDELAVATYWIGRHVESKLACEQLLSGEDLPASERNRVQENLKFALTSLAPPGPQS